MNNFTITKKFKNVMMLAFRKGLKKYGTEITFCEAAEIIDTYKTFNNLPDFIIDFLTDFLMEIEGNENITYKINYDNDENMIITEIPEVAATKELPAAEEIPAAGPAALEIMNILDNKAAKKEYSNNIYTYTFNNNSKIEFIAAVLDCDNRINIFDGMGGFYKRLEGRADILNYINKIEEDQKPAAQDLEALKWDYENSINYIIEDINGRALSADGGKTIYFNILKDAEILELYHGENLYKSIKGYINIMNYINTFIADNFTPCGGCGATGEHWDGGACNMCAGTGLKLR